MVVNAYNFYFITVISISISFLISASGLIFYKSFLANTNSSKNWTRKWLNDVNTCPLQIFSTFSENLSRISVFNYYLIVLFSNKE